jgi:hypothetical protein
MNKRVGSINSGSRLHLSARLDPLGFLECADFIRSVFVSLAHTHIRIRTLPVTYNNNNLTPWRNCAFDLPLFFLSSVIVHLALITRAKAQILLLRSEKTDPVERKGVTKVPQADNRALSVPHNNVNLCGHAK